MFNSVYGAMGRQLVNAVPTIGQVLREFAPAYLSHISPLESQLLADRHRMMGAQLGHVEDRNTRAIVAAMLLSGSSVGPFTKQ